MASPVAAGCAQWRLDLWSMLSGAASSPYSDVIFRVVDPKGAGDVQPSEESRTEQSFHAHKVVIYHTAPMLFAALLSVAGDDAAPQRATIELEPAVFKLCLEYLYTDSITSPGVTMEDMTKLISFGEHYEIAGLSNAKAWQETSTTQGKCWTLPDASLLATVDTPPPPRPLLAARHNPLFADATLLVDSQRFPVHKAILAARSAYFARMFGSGLAESFQSEIALPEASASAFELFLDYMYSATLRDWSLLTPDAAVELIPVCHQYGATSLVNPQSADQADTQLKAICEQRLAAVLDGDNVCLIYDIALFHNAHELAKLCGSYIRRNLEEVSNSPNFVYLSEAGVEAAADEVHRVWTMQPAARTTTEATREAERRLTVLAACHSRLRRGGVGGGRTATAPAAASGPEAEAEEEEEEDDDASQEEVALSLQKAEKLWRSLFWRAMMDLVSVGASDPSVTVPVRSQALLDYVRRKGESIEVIHLQRPAQQQQQQQQQQQVPRRPYGGYTSSLRTTSSAGLAVLLGVAPTQVLKELVFFRFHSPKRRHAVRHNAYDLVVVLLNGSRLVDEDRLKRVLFGNNYKEEEEKKDTKKRSYIALASFDAVFHRTGFPARQFPAFYHRRPLRTIVDSELVSSAQQDPIFYANCGACHYEPSFLEQNGQAMKIHFDTLMRLLPLEQTSVESISAPFPAP